MIKNPEKEKNRKVIRVLKGDHQVTPPLRVADISNIVVEDDESVWKQTRVLK